MPRGISNWSYKDVKRFLELHDYAFHKDVDGSHEYWISPSKLCIVDVNFHGAKSYPERTLESMIRDSEKCGLDKKHWKRWANGQSCC